MQQARAIKQTCLPGRLGAIRQVRPGGGGAAGLAGSEVYPPLPPTYLPGGAAEKEGAGFQQGVYKITHLLQTSPSNIAIYDNYTGGTRKIRGHMKWMGPQGEIEIGPCEGHTRRVQAPEARSSSLVFCLLSSGGKGRQPLPPSNRPAGAKPGSIPGRAATPRWGVSSAREKLPQTRSMARGFRAIYADLGKALMIEGSRSPLESAATVERHYTGIL